MQSYRLNTSSFVMKFLKGATLWLGKGGRMTKNNFDLNATYLLTKK